MSGRKITYLTDVALITCIVQRGNVRAPEDPRNAPTEQTPSQPSLMQQRCSESASLCSSDFGGNVGEVQVTLWQSVCNHRGGGP